MVSASSQQQEQEDLSGYSHSPGGGGFSEMAEDVTSRILEVRDEPEEKSPVISMLQRVTLPKTS